MILRCIAMYWIGTYEHIMHIHRNMIQFINKDPSDDKTIYAAAILTHIINSSIKRENWWENESKKDKEGILHLCHTLTSETWGYLHTPVLGLWPNIANNSKDCQVGHWSHWNRPTLVHTCYHLLKPTQTVKYTKTNQHTSNLILTEVNTDCKMRILFSLCRNTVICISSWVSDKSLPLIGDCLVHIQQFPLLNTCTNIMHTNKSAHKQPCTINKCNLYANDPDRNSETSERPVLSTTTAGFFWPTSLVRESKHKTQ